MESPSHEEFSSTLTLWHTRVVTVQESSSTAHSPYPVPLSQVAFETAERINDEFDTANDATDAMDRYSLPLTRGSLRPAPLERGLLGLRYLVQVNLPIETPAFYLSGSRQTEWLTANLSTTQSYLAGGRNDTALLFYDRALEGVIACTSASAVYILQMLSHIFSWSMYPTYMTIVQAMLQFLTRSSQSHPIVSAIAMSLPKLGPEARGVITAYQQCIVDSLMEHLGPCHPLVIWASMRLCISLQFNGQTQTARLILDRIQLLRDTAGPFMDAFLRSELDREIGRALYLFDDNQAARQYLSRVLEYCCKPNISGQIADESIRWQLAICNFRLAIPNICRSSAPVNDLHDQLQDLNSYRRKYTINLLRQIEYEEEVSGPSWCTASTTGRTKCIPPCLNRALLQVGELIPSYQVLENRNMRNPLRSDEPGAMIILQKEYHGQIMRSR